MTKYLFSFSIYIAILWIFSGCKKAEKISATPKISLESIAPLEVKNLRDSVVLKIKYEDGDGDLGENTATAQNLFVTDPRINITYGYRIPELTARNVSIAIRGAFTMAIRNNFLTDSVPSQKVAYQLFIRDRAGNQSNTLQLPEITITK